MKYVISRHQDVLADQLATFLTAKGSATWQEIMDHVSGELQWKIGSWMGVRGALQSVLDDGHIVRISDVHIEKYEIKEHRKMITIPVTEYKSDGTVVHTSFEMEQPEPIDLTDFWCECGNPSGDVHYHADEFEEDGIHYRRVSKHHWTCADCGKVTQVG